MIKKVKVKGQLYLVREVKKIDSQDSMGETDYMEKVIKIKKNLPPLEKQRTFIHEYNHAVLWECGLHASIRAWNDEMNEAIVDSLASSFLQLLEQLKKRGNKK